MPSNEKGEMPKPTFDFSQLTWQDSKLSTIAQMRIQQAIAENNVDMLEKALDELDQALALVTRSVPREWVKDGSPEDLDWSDPASFNYILAPYMDKLRTAMSAAREEASKN